MYEITVAVLLQSINSYRIIVYMIFVLMEVKRD